MIIRFNKNVEDEKITQLIESLKKQNIKAVSVKNLDGYSIAILPGNIEKAQIESQIKDVDYYIDEFLGPFKLSSRQFKNESTKIKVKNKIIGGDSLTIMAGPCSISSKENIFDTAKMTSKLGADVLRGGAYKPRTSPYDFQGMGKEGIRLLSAAAAKYGLLSISEVMEISQIEFMSDYVDILQVGSRNMQNFNLLKALGKTQKPVMLKRGFSASYKELLMAAEYVLSEGNPNVILCERGIRTFETYTRNTLDIAAVPVLKELSHLPVIVDPSHGTGKRNLVLPMSAASIAAGANGIIVEVEREPEKASSDSQQTIDFDMFESLVKKAKRIFDLNIED